jgi:hypothetical protein
MDTLVARFEKIKGEKEIFSEILDFGLNLEKNLLQRKIPKKV